MRTFLFLSAAALIALAGCSDNPSSSDDDDGSGGSGGAGVGGSGAAGGSGGSGGSAGGCGPDDAGLDEILGQGPDPEGGDFTLEEALDGLPAGDGPLRAVIRTTIGEITCTFEPEVAPVGVANFVGLARGRRPWLDPVSNEWVKRRFYDGLIFHRIIDDFMAQGGDPIGNGTGGPDYAFGIEIGNLTHSPGTLAYARTDNPVSNGSQFYITEVSTPSLDADYTIFGYCEPLATIEAHTATPTDSNDKPLTDVTILGVDVTRCGI